MERTRGRRRQDARTFTESARRAQIVQAAIETLAELGYARASYAQIAKRAGLSSTGLISYHFAGKEELLDEVVGEVVAAGPAFMVPRIEAAAPRARPGAHLHRVQPRLHGHPPRAYDRGGGGPQRAAARARGPGGPLRPAPRARPDPTGGLSARRPTHRPAAAVRHRRDGRHDPRGDRRRRLPRATDPDLDLSAYAGELADLFDYATRTTPDIKEDDQ